MEAIVVIVTSIAALQVGPFTLHTNVDQITFEVYPLSHELVWDIARW